MCLKFIRMLNCNLYIIFERNSLTLHSSLCRRKDGQVDELQGLQNITLLNLQGNQLSEWTTVLRLGHLPR